MLESEPRVVPVECHECSLRTFVHRKECRARKRRSCHCTKLPASAGLVVPKLENCIPEGACVPTERALVTPGAWAAARGVRTMRRRRRGTIVRDLILSICIALGGIGAAKLLMLIFGWL